MRLAPLMLALGLGLAACAPTPQAPTSPNAATGVYEDLLAAGVNDPVKVTRSALANAASIAALLLTTETLVVEKPEESDDDGHNH